MNAPQADELTHLHLDWTPRVQRLVHEHLPGAVSPTDRLSLLPLRLAELTGGSVQRTVPVAAAVAALTASGQTLNKRLGAAVRLLRQAELPVRDALVDQALQASEGDSDSLRMVAPVLLGATAAGLGRDAGMALVSAAEQLSKGVAVRDLTGAAKAGGLPASAQAVWTRVIGVLASHQPDPAVDRALCIEMLPEVSRTFALSIARMPDPLGHAVRIAYLLCRVVDTIEDDPAIPQPTRERLFDAFDAAMADDEASVAPLVQLGHGIGEKASERHLMAHADAVFREYRALSPAHRDAIRTPVQAMSAGMRATVRRWNATGTPTLDDLADLERYCFHVAGTVGHLLGALFALHARSEGLPPGLSVTAAGVRFGLGLQLVNIVKDVAEDAERGVCFLPRDLLAQAGLTPEDLLDPAKRDAGLSVVHALCDRAAEHLDVADAYTRAWALPEGLEIRRFCAGPLVLARATLNEVRHGDDTLVRGKVPKITRQQVIELLTAADEAIGDDAALGTWLDSLR